MIIVSFMNLIDGKVIVMKLLSLYFDIEFLYFTYKIHILMLFPKITLVLLEDILDKYYEL